MSTQTRLIVLMNPAPERDSGSPLLGRTQYARKGAVVPAAKYCVVGPGDDLRIIYGLTAAPRLGPGLSGPYCVILYRQPPKCCVILYQVLCCFVPGNRDCCVILYRDKTKLPCTGQLGASAKKSSFLEFM